MIKNINFFKKIIRSCRSFAVCVRHPFLFSTWTCKQRREMSGNSLQSILTCKISSFGCFPSFLQKKFRFWKSGFCPKGICNLFPCQCSVTTHSEYVAILWKLAVFLSNRIYHSPHYSLRVRASLCVCFVFVSVCVSSCVVFL